MPTPPVVTPEKSNAQSTKPAARADDEIVSALAEILPRCAI
jgi:hypothetical protein